METLKQCTYSSAIPQSLFPIMDSEGENGPEHTHRRQIPKTTQKNN